MEILHTVYLMLYRLIVAQKHKKINVINYNHETHGLAYTFNAGSWQI